MSGRAFSCPLPPAEQPESTSPHDKQQPRLPAASSPFRSGTPHTPPPPAERNFSLCTQTEFFLRKATDDCAQDRRPSCARLPPSFRKKKRELAEGLPDPPGRAQKNLLSALKRKGGCLRSECSDVCHICVSINRERWHRRDKHRRKCRTLCRRLR